MFQGIFGFVYGLIYKDSLAVLNRDSVTDFMFKSYIGYILFELGLLYITYRSLFAFFTDHGLRLLLIHHLIAMSASYTLVSSDQPGPHYIGMLNFGNEAVVISYSLIVTFRKFGKNDHWFVEYNVKSLPLQYAARQILFMYTVYYFVANFSELISCGVVFYTCFITGISLFTFGLNPYWLYETIVDALEYHRDKNQLKVN